MKKIYILFLVLFLSFSNVQSTFTSSINITSNELKNIFEASVGKENVAYFAAYDYDGNGAVEGFGVTGTITKGYMKNAKMYFINTKGIVTFIKEYETLIATDYYLDSKNHIIDAGSSKFFIMLQDYGAKTELYGVKENNFYQPKVSGEHCSFAKQKNGFYLAQPHEGGPGYYRYWYKYDDQLKEFIRIKDFNENAQNNVLDNSNIQEINLPTSSKKEVTEEYYSINVKYSDTKNVIEKLDVMLKNNQSYVNARMLAERLGYQFNSNADFITISNTKDNTLPLGITQFSKKSTKVSQTFGNQFVNDLYTAPFPSITNEKGDWIPFEYSLLILNSGFLYLDNCILIDIPTKDMVDYYSDISKNIGSYSFDWQNDFGYTEKDLKILAGSSHIVNLFNDTLENKELLTTLLTKSYDQKYSKKFALLLCTNSTNEYEATVKKIKLFNDTFGKDEQLGDLLSKRKKSLDKEVGMLYDECEAILKDIEAGNLSTARYNKTYQMLENALDNQELFSKTSGVILNLQKSVTKAIDFTKFLGETLEVTSYIDEFNKQDTFSINALTDYIDKSTSTLSLCKPMNKSIKDYMTVLKKDIVSYSASRYIENNLKKLLEEELEELLEDQLDLGFQANIALFSWNLASNIIPFISEGLEGADNFELALYAQCFQANALTNYLNLRDQIFNNPEKVTSEQLYQLSQYGYIYLKSCYITRNAAIASLIAKRNNVYEQIQPLIDYQNSINKEIAELMTKLKSSEPTNEKNIYGFLPSDNKQDLDKERLQAWIKSQPNNEDNLESNKKSNLNIEHEEEIKIWQDFIKSKKYTNYISNYNQYELEYVITDLNAEGTPELLIKARNPKDVSGFSNTFTFALKNKEIILVNEMYGYGEFRYSPSRNMIIGVPEFKTFNRTYYSPFYKLKDYKFEFAFEVGMNEGKSFYRDAQNNKKDISDEERNAYYNDEINFEWQKIQ